MQPCLRLQLSVMPVRKNVGELSSRLERVLNVHLAPIAAGRSADLVSEMKGMSWLSAFLPQAWPVVEMLNQWFVRLQETAGMPVAQGIRCELLGPNRDKVTTFVALLVPSLTPTAVLSVLPWVVQQMNRWLSEGQIAIEDIPQKLEKLKKFAPPGTNNRLLIGAAHALGVPVMPMPGGSHQYGWGARSRWMDSTFTDETSTISAKLARSKVAANRWLAQAGFPVPQQAVVKSLNDALQKAKKFGYPVVVKPFDKDGGVGVSAGLQNEAEVSLAYVRAKKHSDNLIVEQHIEGKDYRLGVINRKLGWATYREPAGVRGNGTSTVLELIEQANADPRRGTQSWSLMHPIQMDEEAKELLAAQGIDGNTVVANGQFIVLRRSANISSGGTPYNVIDEIHPDNVALAEAVARLFKLDYAGIDFITPDITRSWREVGGAICEVNGQPQFSVAAPETATAAIKGLLQGDSRIPTVVVLAEQSCEALLTHLAAQMAQTKLNLGFSHSGGLWVNGGYLKTSRDSAFKDGQALLINPMVDAVVIVTDGKEWLRTGMPLDRFDLLVITPTSYPKVLNALKPQCSEAWTCSHADLETPAWADKVSHAIKAFDGKHRNTELKMPSGFDSQPCLAGVNMAVVG